MSQARSVLVSIGTGLACVAVVGGVAFASPIGLSTAPSAHADLMLVPAAGLSPRDVLRAQAMIGTDAPAKAATAVLTAPDTIRAATRADPRADAVDPADVQVTVTNRSRTGHLLVDVTAPADVDVVAATQHVIDTATPIVQAVSGPFTLARTGPPALVTGTATAAATLQTIAATVMAFMLGCLGAHATQTRAERRRAGRA
jgi:hypothetical protein